MSKPPIKTRRTDAEYQEHRSDPMHPSQTMPGVGWGRYCFTCNGHRRPEGGKPVGRLRLFKCAECLAKAKEAENGR